VIDKNRIPKELLSLLEEKLQGASDDITFPPPAFDAMKGEFIAFDVEKETFTNKFPVLKEHLNPYGYMQGGFISAAIDNTIGPLSLLVSSPNFTRSMEIKYGKVISPSFDYIYVTARFIKKKKRQLFFEAIVANSDGEKLVSAKSTHWIIG